MSTTHVFDLRVTGSLKVRDVIFDVSPEEVEVQVAGTIIDCGDRSAHRVRGPQGGRVTGIVPESEGRIVQLCNVGAEDLFVIHEDPLSPEEARFIMPRNTDGELVTESCAWFWYDYAVQRWRRIQ